MLYNGYLPKDSELTAHTADQVIDLSHNVATKIAVKIASVSGTYQLQYCKIKLQFIYLFIIIW